jgi:hypothetical protein
MAHSTLWLIIVAVVAALLGGCSGAGAPARNLGEVSLQSLAADQLSAIAQFSAWCGVLYKKSDGEVNITDFEDLGDGAFRLAGTNSDGSAFEYFYDVPNSEGNQAGHGTLSWPATDTSPARIAATRWSAETRVGDISSQSITDLYTDGAELTCDLQWDHSATPWLQEWNGTAKTPTGTAMSFHMDRRQSMRDILKVTLPDGSRLEMTIPQQEVTGAPYWPDWTAGATGTFRNASGHEFSFKAVGSPTSETWTEWQLEDGCGVTGTFTLRNGFAGSGQFKRDGTMQAALSWAAGSWQGSLDLLGSGSQAVSPSAAARDFQIQNWISNANLLSPAPMY